MTSTLRRVTCKVTLSDGLQYLDLARALYTQVSPDSVYAIQPLGKNVFNITFKNDSFFKKAMDNGLVHISGNDFDFVPVDGLTRWITVRDVPVWVDRAAFITAFTPFGQVLQHEEEEWKDLPGVKTGSRRLQIKMLELNGVPNILKVGQHHRARVFYPGVEYLCFKCKKKGHKFAECPQRTHSEIIARPSTSSAETPQVPPPAIEDSSDNINPATELPYDPSETPPAKPQMRRWIDPLDDPVLNKSPNQNHAPQTDIIPAGNFGPAFAGSINDISLAALEHIINGTLPDPNMNSDDDEYYSDNDIRTSMTLADRLKENFPTSGNRPCSSPAKRRNSQSPTNKQQKKSK